MSSRSGGGVASVVAASGSTCAISVISASSSRGFAAENGTVVQADHHAAAFGT
jgi:hypothetical protein